MHAEHGEGKMEGKTNLCGKNGQCRAANKDERATCRFALDEFGGFDGCMYLAWDFSTCCSEFAVAAAKIAQEAGAA